MRSPGSPPPQPIPDSVHRATSARQLRDAPESPEWDTDVRIVARTIGETVAITVYSRSAYQAIYVAGMPEYLGDTQDHQLFYNAVIFPKKG